MVKFCSKCGAPIEEAAKFCSKCGAKQTEEELSSQTPKAIPEPRMQNRNKKDKVTAGILGILLGGFGAHKFYLGKKIKGIIYLLTCWTGIPVIIGLIEGIKYLLMSPEDFDDRYNNI